jgi:aryl-alcohol dehydrogenase-like predicted oxidoreductase
MKKMKYKKLGKSGLKVSELCLGTMNFGPYTTEEDSFKIMDRALEFGINFFDTANVYGQDKGRGVTEEIIGRWMKQGGGRREKIVLATKAYADMSGTGTEGSLSAYHIKRACEGSLQRLQTDHIDLYQMHHIDRNTPWEEIWYAMEQLQREGKVTYIGGSNFPAWNIAEAHFTAKERHSLGLVSEQSVYSLRNRFIEMEVIPACERYGLALLPWSPLAGGMLGGILDEKNEGRRNRPQLKEALQKLRPQVEKYEALCKEIGEEPADVALAWVLKNPVITSPIIGPRTMEQLEENVKATEITLSEEVLKKLDEIWPGPGLNPGKPAPEAYAW